MKTNAPSDADVQAAADAGLAEGPEGRRYRRLFEALRALPAPRPPPGFAHELVAIAAQPPAGFERWEAIGVRAGLLALAGAALLAPVAGALWLQFLHLPPSLPWPLLLATAAGLVALRCCDRRAAHFAG